MTREILEEVKKYTNTANQSSSTSQQLEASQKSPMDNFQLTVGQNIISAAAA